MALDSNIGPITVTSSSTALSDAAANLGSGQFQTWDANIGNAPGYQELIYVTTTAHYDATRREIQYLGKGAGASGNFNHRHFIYSESSRQWRTTGTTLFPDFGHAWCCAMDGDTGDYYFHRNVQNYLERMVRSVEAGQGTANSPWTTTSQPSVGYVRPPNNYVQAGMAYHPNLFGTGDGGIFLWQGVQYTPQDAYMWTWRKSTNTWYRSATNYYGSAYYAHQSGHGIYVPGLDAVIIAANGPGGQRLISVPAGAGTTHAFTDLGAGPMTIEGNSGGSACMVVDPANTSHILVLRKTSPYTYWRSTNGGSTWSSPGTHGFGGLTFDTAGSWIACSIPDYGIVWAMADDGCSAGNVGIWKP